MTFSKKIKQLRKERGWSQDDLAEKIDTDGRQISRYENGKFMPSADVIIKIAQIFDVSIDYLLIDNMPKKSLHSSNEPLIAKLEEISEITNEDRESLSHIIDAIAAKNKLKSFANNLR